MAALTINGINIPVVESSRQPVTLGGEERTESGKVRSFERATFYEYRYKTGPLTQSDSALMQSLVRGDGQVLNFESEFTTTSFLWTTRGRVPSPAPVINVDCQRFAGKWGVYGLRVLGGKTVSWPLGLGEDWSLVLYQRSDGAGAWTHTIIRSAGDVFVDGAKVPGTTTQPFVTVESDTLVLRGAPSTWLFDDVVALPYVLPDAQCLEAYVFHSARAWPSLPYVLAEGERIPAGGMKMKGTVDTIEHPDFKVNGSPVDVLNFTLKQTP